MPLLPLKKRKKDVVWHSSWQPINPMATQMETKLGFLQVVEKLQGSLGVST